MTKLVHGEVQGLTWYEVPVEAARYERSLLPEGTRTVAVIAPIGKFLHPSVEACLATNPEDTNFVSRSIPFRPLAHDAIPGREIMYNRHDFNSDNITAWALQNLDIPPELDLKFELEPYRGNLHVIATTMKRGVLAEVRRKINTEILLEEALAEHIPYFLKSCRRPTGPTSEFTIGSHCATVLKRLSDHGVQELERWLDDERRRTHGKSTLIIPRQMFADHTIDSVRLTMADNSNAIQSEMTFEGGHSLKDDDTGVEVTVKAQIPDTMRSTLRRRSLGDLIGADWASHLEIRTVRDANGDEGTLTLRAFGDAVPFEMPEGIPWTDEQIDDILRQAGESEYQTMTTVQEAARPVLRKLDRKQLALVLVLLRMRGNVDLTPFGQEGWVVNRRGREIVLETCPTVEYAQFLREYLE